MPPQEGTIFRSTLLSRPNKVSLECPYVRMSVRQQEVPLIFDVS